MLSSAEFFKDETLQGISRSIKQLHQMQAEAEQQKMENFGITKQNPHFKSLLHHIDMGLSLGLNEPKKGYWPLVKKVCHKSTVHMVQSHAEASDEIKRGQIWLFLTFMESSLPSYIKLVRSNEKNLKPFYKKYALLRDTERCMIFEQMLVGLEMVIFVLDFNSPLCCFTRDPLFKPTDFYASKKTAMAEYAPQPTTVPIKARPPQVSSGTQTPPDVTMINNADGTQKRLTPDLLVDNRFEHRNFNRKFDENGIVTHLRSKKRVDSGKKKQRSRLESEDSISVNHSNELEDDNYIPEFQDSLPIKVAVPDKPASPDMNHEDSQADLMDENVYENFLLGLEAHPETRQHVAEPPQGLSLDQEISNSISNQASDPRVLSPDLADSAVKESHVSFDEDHPNVVLSSSVQSEGAYRITYVSDDEFDDDVDGNHIHRSRNQMRSLSLDSFDKFCRSGSTGKDDRDKSKSVADDDDDDDNDDDDFVRRELEKPSPAVEAMDENPFPASKSIDLSSEAIGTSPMSEKLSKESVDKVLTARFDTTSGILLPTLPRRPAFTDACGMYHDISVDRNVIVLLSLEIFENSTEVLKKMFNVYVGYIFGIRKNVSLAVTTENIYLLAQNYEKECGYTKELCIPIDSINKIQSGLNMQDVLISHDGGKLQLWTGDEILTKNIISTLSSCLGTENAKTVSVEQMKVEFHKNIDLKTKDWLIYIENVEEPEILHFAVVDFHSLALQEPELKVLKCGRLQRKLSYLGVVPYWEPSILSLRGTSLYEYSGKGNHELKQVLDLGKKCGGCVRIKPSEKSHGFKVLSADGSTPLLELAADSEEDANDWIVHICQVVADSKHGDDCAVKPYIDGVAPRALLLTASKLYVFLEDSRTRRLRLVDSCTIQDIPQICVDNEDRSYCALQIDDSIDSYLETEKRTWIIRFHSEYELGKFEQRIFAVWHRLYQVPLQFVLLAENDFKRSLRRCLMSRTQSAVSSIDDTGRSISELASV